MGARSTLRSFWAVGCAVVLALAACGDDVAECTPGNCPNLAGVYNISFTQITGQCPYQLPLLPPALTLEQSPDGTRVSARLIDPVYQLEQDIAGEVLVLEDNDDPEFVGSFQAFTRTVRPAATGSRRLVTLELFLTATVTLEDDERFISGQLVGWNIDTSTDSPLDEEETSLNRGVNEGTDSSKRNATSSCSTTLVFSGFAP